MPDRDPNAQIDRVLRRALRPDEDRPSSGACLDFETLARWSDNRLTTRERAEAERHASGCGRCQALLAAMARTAEKPVAAPTRSGWASGRVGRYPWLVPAAAAGAAVAVWIAVRPADVPAPSLLPPGVEGPAEPAAAPQAPKAETFARVPDPGAPQRKSAAPGLGDLRSDAAPPAEASPPPAAERRQGASGASADDAGPVAESRRKEAAASPVVPQPASEAGARLSLAAPPAVSIPSADSAGLWRIAAGRAIQVSVDGGATWTTRLAATDLLTAGVCPSAAVCWVVGSAGTVLVTADGATWERRAVPGNPDLVAVVADDERSATVTATDGHVFSTRDGGRRWALR